MTTTTPSDEEIRKQRDAFKEYIADCDRHAIVPDTAGAFSWAWNRRALLARYAAPAVQATDGQLMRNRIGSIKLPGEGIQDNLAIALATYFEDDPECPIGGEKDECGWSVWAIERTNIVLDELTNLVAAQPSYSASLNSSVAVQQEPPTLETQRADFHKWCATNGYKTRFVEGGECPMGLPVYDDHRTHAAWWAFQKAVKLYATQSPKAEQAKDAAEDAELLDERGDLRCDLPSPRYKVGNEFKPFHPRASHVRPEWRDGWNACFVAAIKAQGGKQ